MRPSFKVRFAFFHTCGSREQCTGPSQKNTSAQNTRSTAIQTHTKGPFGYNLFLLKTKNTVAK